MNVPRAGGWSVSETTALICPGVLYMVPLCLTVLLSLGTVKGEVPADGCTLPGRDGGQISGRVYSGIDQLNFRFAALPDLPPVERILAAGDFDGNKLDDLLFRTGDGLRILLFLEGLPPRVLPIERTVAPIWWFRIAAGDFDGDGTEELIAPAPDGSHGFMLRYSGGTLAASPLELEVRPSQQLFPYDHGCDGVMDLVAAEAGAHGLVELFRREGNKFTRALQIHFDWPIRGTARVENGCDVLISQGGPEWSAYWFRLEFGQNAINWASFMDGRSEWSANRVGDFNGDGWEDVITRLDDRLFRWWAGVSNGRTALERAAPEPFPGYPDAVVEAVGDFDGNGADDLVARAAGKLLIAYAEPGQRGPRGGAIAGVEVELSTGQKTVTDDEGRFTFSRLPAGTYTVRARDDDRVFQHNPRNVRVRDCVRTPLQLGAVAPIPRTRDGAVERFGPPPEGPFLCHGYSPGGEEPKWVRHMKCPPQFAAYGSDDPDEDAKIAADIASVPICCKLPRTDILTADTVEVDSDCPPDHVITRVKAELGVDGRPVLNVICTKINTFRYQLGARTNGTYWGIGNRLRKDARRMSVAQIPEAIRAAFVRNHWNQSEELDGCIGEPPGSVLVTRQQGGCAGMKFSELQYRGAAGDPAPGTPVKMFPDCEYVDNIYDPATECKLSESVLGESSHERNRSAAISPSSSAVLP